MDRQSDYDSYRVLIVDDNEAIHEDFRKILDQSKGRRASLAEAEEFLFGNSAGSSGQMTYQLESAYQGQEALTLVKKSLDEDTPYALAFIDIRMPPGWDGLETLQKVWEVDPQLQIVLCTAYSDYSLEDIIKVVGHTDNLVILKKPFDTIEVKQLTNALTKKWELMQHMRSRLEDLDKLVYTRTQELEQANAKLTQEAGERTLAERALATEKQLLDVTLQSISDAVVTTDLDGRILFINDGAALMTGWEHKAVHNRSFSEVLPVRYADDGEGPEDLVAAVLEAGERIEFEHPIMLEEEGTSLKRLTINGAPLTDQTGQIIGVVFTFRDSTTWHLLEQERFNANKLESIGLLAGGIAHDFNNILTAILGNISGIRSGGDLSEKQLKRLSSAETATRRAELLTKQLLTFAKGGAPVLKPSSIRELIQESADFVLRGSSVKCDYDFPDDLWTVNIDEGQVSQVINNIVINAQQAMARGGSITISGENMPAGRDELPHQLPEGDYVRILIKDTGMGIPAEDIEHIFDPYFTTKHKGSGLGLASCYSIIQKHKGHISAVSEEGVGTTFYFLLPAFPNKQVAPSPVPAEPPAGQGYILIMDDEEEIRDLCQDLLLDLGYEVAAAPEGDEAVRMYKEAQDTGRPFDAVVLDLTIQGGMGGKEAIEQLLAIDPGVTAIVASGYSADPVMANYESYGFKGVIQKPFDFPDIGNILDSVLNG